MSDDKKNMFGGGNPGSLYVPLSEDEQEVLYRLVEANNLEVFIHEWNYTITSLRLLHGDLRVSVIFRVNFDRPAGTMPVHYLDLDLRTHDGISLFRKKYPTVMKNGQPIQVGDGIFLDLAWDIAIDHMSPELVKALKPGALGLTSRRLDPVTRERTVSGNMRLTPEQTATARVLDKFAAQSRAQDEKNLQKVIPFPGRPGPHSG